jgi:ribonuclease HI
VQGESSLTSKEKIILSFHGDWGKPLIYQAEALAIYMGMHLIPTNTSSRLIVIGDSNLIVKGLQRFIKNDQPNLMRIFHRIRKLELKFKLVSYHHIYRKQNEIADSLAKVAKQLEQSKLRINEDCTQIYLP